MSKIKNTMGLFKNTDLGIKIKNKHFLNFLKVLLLFLLFLFLNSNALNNEFTMDDNALISSNRLTHNLEFAQMSFGKPLFGVESGTIYRPLLQIFLMWEYLLFKSNPFGYHFVNILLHFINSLLFFKIINILFGNYELSLLSSFLFAIHPINSYVINICVGSDLYLGNMLMLLSILSFLVFLSNKKYKFYFISIIYFVIALLFRENAALFPFYLLCLIFYCCKKENVKKYLYLIAPFFILSFVYLFSRLFFFSLSSAIFNDVGKSFNILDYIVGFSRLILLYLSSIVIPGNIVWIWSIAPRAGITNIEFVALLLICLIIVYLFARLKKHRIGSFCILWFLIGALPLLLVIGSRYDFGFVLEPHWLYFSSIGAFLLISVFLLKLKKHINLTLWICITVAMLSFFCQEARKQNSLWREPKVYYEHWLRKFPNNMARLNLASIALENGDCDNAEALFNEAISHLVFEKDGLYFFSPRKAALIYSNVGNFYYFQDRYAEALAMYNEAIKINPKNSMAYFFRAVTFLKTNQKDKAVLDFERAIEVDPYILEAHYNLAILYAESGNEDKALEEYYKAIKLDKNCFKL
ncbi:tetratricopeptide repeat protein [Candidatus Omnitrophota bacterium]